MWTQELHPKKRGSLKVELQWPERHLGKELKIVITVVDAPSVADQLLNDPFFQYLDSLKIDTRGWKFIRDDANERHGNTRRYFHCLEGPVLFDRYQLQGYDAKIATLHAGSDVLYPEDFPERNHTGSNA